MRKSVFSVVGSCHSGQRRNFNALVRRAALPNTMLVIAVLSTVTTHCVHAAGLTDNEKEVVTGDPGTAPLPGGGVSASKDSRPQLTPRAVEPGHDQTTAEGSLPAISVSGIRASDYTAGAARSTTRTDTPLKDYPASIQVVPSEVLQDRGVTRTDQLVDNVSGVHAEANYGGNEATFFNIRGFSESNGLRDGFRNYGYYAFRDVQNIDRVEVFKGPAGALYGGIGAVGGYINTVSKHPEWENSGEIGTTVGSYGLSRTTLDVNRVVNDNLSFRLNGAVEKNDTFRDGTAYHSWSIAPAITWDNHHGTSLTLLTEFNHLNRDGFDFGVPAVANYAALSRNRYYGLQNGVYPGVAGDYGKNDTQAETLMFEHAFSDNWKVRLAGQYSEARQRSTQTFPNDTSPVGNLLDYSVYSGADEESRQYSARAELVGEFYTGSLKHSLLAGVDYGYQAVTSRGSTVNTMTLDLFNPGYLSGLTPGDPLLGHEGQGRDFGVYVQDLITLTREVKIMIGLRGDRFLNRATDSGEVTGEGQQSAFSPRIGAVWQPMDRTSLFADWSLSHSPNVGHSGSNVTYDAEVAQQFEVGGKEDLIKDRLNASVALFNLDRNHILTTDPTDPLLQVLTGKQRSQGVEIDVTGNLSSQWKAIFTYTYTVAKVRSDTTYPEGDVLSNVPRNSASLWTVYALQSIPGLRLGAGLYYVGARQATLPNTFKLGSYVRTDAMASYQRGRWTTQFNIFNVFNRKYYTGGSAGTFDYTLMPSPPVTAQVSVSYKF
jgi:iron complex outermembrane receptor protein